MVQIHTTLLNNYNMEDIDFVFLEYTNFLNKRYKSFGNDWVRICDDKIIYNITEILDEFKTERPELWQSK